MTGHVLIAAGLVVAWCLFVLASPTRRCGRCKGTRITTSRLTGKTRPCTRCRGTGRHYRLAATAVHRLFWAAASDRIRTTLSQRHRKDDHDVM
jgi:hypothetical protein